MLNFYKIIAKKNKNAEKYFSDTVFYAREIKKLFQKDFPDVRIILFGSSVRGDYLPDSDIDILFISSKIPKDLFAQAEIKIRIKEFFPDAPFEIHLITPQEYENWYRNFIKGAFKEA